MIFSYCRYPPRGFVAPSNLSEIASKQAPEASTLPVPKQAFLTVPSLAPKADFLASFTLVDPVSIPLQVSDITIDPTSGSSISIIAPSLIVYFEAEFQRLLGTYISA